MEKDSPLKNRQRNLETEKAIGRDLELICMDGDIITINRGLVPNMRVLHLPCQSLLIILGGWESVYWGYLEGTVEERNTKLS